MFSKATLILICMATLALATGCSRGKPDLDFANVTGVVTFQGQPVPDATVCFVPEKGRASYGKTNDQGEYSMKYLGQDWGALVGRHTVRITTLDRIESPDGEVKKIPEILPAKFHSKTTLTAEIEPGDNEVDFILEK